MTDSAPRFRKTPPAIKWLLNERAMLAGEMQRLQDLINPIQAKIEQHALKVAALDNAMAIADSRVNPVALGNVNAHSKSYGGRGGLTKFIVSEVFAAGDTGINTVKLTLSAAERFGFLIVTPSSMSRHCSNVRRTLLRLQDRGVIECVSASSGSGKPSVWRKRTEFGMFDELLAQRNAIEGGQHG